MNGPEFSELLPKGDPVDNQKPKGVPSYDEIVQRAKEMERENLARSREKRIEAFQRSKSAGKKVMRPVSAPPIDGKMASAGKDDDGDELVPDGKGGKVMKKFLNI